MSDLTATTTLAVFFNALASAIETGATLPDNRVYVVDKLRLQDAAVPNIQIEPVSMVPLSPNTGVHVCLIEYKVHAVVKVEYDMGGRMTKRLVGTKSAFLNANFVTAILAAMADTTSYSRQIFVRMDGGAHDDALGLTTAATTFQCHVRIQSDA